MIVALMLGRKGSVGFPGKNLYPLLGRPVAWYALNAAASSASVDAVYVSTDDEALMRLGASLGAETIHRPPHLLTSEALGEDAYAHGYRVIRERVGEEPELLVLLFANAPTVSAAQIDLAVDVLRRNSSYDSAVTVSRYNMWSPLRARRQDAEGLLQPFVPLDAFDSDKLSCDRDSQGDSWFADVALSVVRPTNFDALSDGQLPQRWMGRRIFPVENTPGLDIDYEWQLGQAAWWLERRGFSDASPEERQRLQAVLAGSGVVTSENKR